MSEELAVYANLIRRQVECLGACRKCKDDNVLAPNTNGINHPRFGCPRWAIADHHRSHTWIRGVRHGACVSGGFALCACWSLQPSGRATLQRSGPLRLGKFDGSLRSGVVGSLLMRVYFSIGQGCKQQLAVGVCLCVRNTNGRIVRLVYVSAAMCVFAFKGGKS